ncbi:MAG: hypothetical protein UV68_C0011G0019, partial [Candidatus Collierbacteria bacterium GW2011_GWC2_43_12]
MKSPWKLLILALLALSLLVPRSVSAGDYVIDAIEALKASNVYVAPGTEGTDYDTANKLEKTLITDDNIVLVMLPSDALVGTDLYTIARRISEGLGNQKTIGLAVGREVIGYSLILPEGVASDKMMRANSVSHNSVAALITFTQNIHSYVMYNPQPTLVPTPEPTPTPRPTMTPIELPKAKDISWPVWLVMVVAVLAVVVWVFVTIKKN